MDYLTEYQNKSSPKSFGKSRVATSHTAENGLSRCVCYYLCNAHCRRVQSLSRRYATSTPHRRTHDDGNFEFGWHISLQQKSNSTSYHPVKVICGELRIATHHAKNGLDPTHHSKRHPDPISGFFHSSPTGQTERQTDRHTDRWQSDKSAGIAAYALYCIDRERRG